MIHMSKLHNIKIARLTNIIGPGCVSDSGWDSGATYRMIRSVSDSGKRRYDVRNTHS